MSATIRMFGKEFTLDAWEWTGEADHVVELLNAKLDPLGPSGSDPNPSLHEAERIVAKLGGEIVRYDETEYDPEMIY